MPATNALSNPFSTPQQRRYPVGAACLGSAISLIEKLYRVRRHLCNVGAIVEASKEQATGLKEINTAVNTMDQGTQQNAAMVEETTAAAHSLAREAEQLFDLLGQFNVGTARVRANASVQPSRPSGSPVRHMATKIARAFDGNAALKGPEQCEEF